jgi:hypothetical protein
MACSLELYFVFAFLPSAFSCILYWLTAYGLQLAAVFCICLYAFLLSALGLQLSAVFCIDLQLYFVLPCCLSTSTLEIRYSTFDIVFTSSFLISHSSFFISLSILFSSGTYASCSCILNFFRKPEGVVCLSFKNCLLKLARVLNPLS